MLTRRSFALGLAAGLAPVQALAAIVPKGKDQTDQLAAAIADAQAKGAALELGPGLFRVSGLKIEGNITLSGVPGLTTLVGNGEAPLISFGKADSVQLSGISFKKKGETGDIVYAGNADRFVMQNCSFLGGGSGLHLQGCGGLVSGNMFSFHEVAGLFALDSTGLEISSNTVTDIGNNGIQVWQSELREDGTLVLGNQVHRVATRAGGTGQNGNGINIYRAGNVVVANNRTTDCAFSGIRNNSGSNVQIIGNSISRCNEVGLYTEFDFQGAVIANNTLEDVGLGISITNFDVGGRMATCTGNIVRRVKGVPNNGQIFGAGIAAEADTTISNNVIEDVNGFGISLGWGDKTRNISATGNIVRQVKNGIGVSVVEGAGPYLVANNIIDGATQAAITGTFYLETRGGDFTAPGAKVPAHVTLSGNVVR